MEIRPPDPAESDRIREVADSSMTTHYRLSPDQIDEITDEVFANEATAARVEDGDALLQVAEVEDEGGDQIVAGVVTGSVEGPVGTLEWLFVDPEQAGQGIGTALFETADDALREAAEYVRVGVLEESTDGHEFVERFDYERVGERSVELAGVTLVEYVFADPGVEPEAVLEAAEEEAREFPETEERDGQIVATADDGETVYVSPEDEQSGEEASFYVTYADAAHEEQLGYYCSNCGSLETTMNEMERIECANCGNHHTSKSKQTYDDSFL